MQRVIHSSVFGKVEYQLMSGEFISGFQLSHSHGRAGNTQTLGSGILEFTTGEYGGIMENLIENMKATKALTFKYKCPFEIHHHEEFGFYAKHPTTGFYLNSYGVLTKVGTPKYSPSKLELYNFILTRSDGVIYDKSS